MTKLSTIIRYLSNWSNDKIEKSIKQLLFERRPEQKKYINKYIPGCLL